MVVVGSTRICNLGQFLIPGATLLDHQFCVFWNKLLFLSLEEDEDDDVDDLYRRDDDGMEDEYIFDAPPYTDE